MKNGHVLPNTLMWDPKKPYSPANLREPNLGAENRFSDLQIAPPTAAKKTFSELDLRLMNSELQTPNSELRTAPVGRVVATERRPNTAYQFHFWTPKLSKVGIGTLVKVCDDEVTAYGVVVEGERFSDLDTPMSDFVGQRQDPGRDAASRRPDLKLYTAAVLRIEPEEPLQPVPLGEVFLADDQDIATALRMEEYRDKTGIPVGLYQNGDELSPIYLDWEFLLGPEAAHLNLTGVSGLATKTSAVEFILGAIFQASRRLRERRPERDWSVAAVCFNVKGPDLLFLDQPQEVDDDDPRAAAYRAAAIAPLDEPGREGRTRDMYQRLGLPCEPFQHVRYFAPLHTDYQTPNTLRCHPALANDVDGLCWGLNDILPFAEVVLNQDDLDAKADALVQFIQNKVADHDSDVNGQRIKVQSFQDLQRWFEAVLDAKENKRDEPCRIHHYETVRKVANRLCNLAERYPGLISPDNENLCDLPWKEKLKDGTVYCIDVSKFDSQAQDLVFTRVVTELRHRMEANELGVDHVVVFVDELNKYAPSDGPDTYLRKTLLDISERGRYLGLVLFSAQQFRSQVHKRVVGNSGSFCYGRMDMDELATPGYSTLTQAVKEKLSTLSKGQLMLRHPHFSQPIFVKFPKPNVLRGADGVKLYKPSEGKPFTQTDAMLRNFQRLNPRVTRRDVEDRVVGMDAHVVREAMVRVMNDGSEDPLRRFDEVLRKKAGISVAPSSNGEPPVHLQVPPDDDDPFA